MMPGLRAAASIAPVTVLPRWRGAAVAAENGLLALAFLLMVLLPLAEIVLRATLHTGIEGAATIVQHLTLAIGMLGAAVAAREGRLLTLASSALIRGKVVSPVRFAAAMVGAAVTLVLLSAAIDFVAVERAAGGTVALGIPTWVAQLPLPLGFGLIAVRLAWSAAPAASGRIAAAACAAGAAAAFLQFPSGLTAVTLGVLVITTLLGTPIFVAVGGVATVLLLREGVPAAAVAVNHYSLVVNPSLPAIPIFTLAGYMLAESRAPGRLVEVFDALFGRFRGGAAIVTVLACTFFTCFTGASGVTILALGGLVMPLLVRARYRTPDALALVTGSGLPGVILLPALPLLLYAVVARVSIEDMFLGGLLPALLMIAVVAAWGIRRQPPDGSPRPPFCRMRARDALLAAKWELSLPLVPLATLGAGLATPVEAASATALYSIFIACVVHRDLRPLRDLPRVVAECGLMVGGILLVLGVALGLTNYLVDAEVPDRLLDWARQAISSPWLFLLALNVLLLAVGCVMDIYTAIVVLAPLVTPLGAAYGIHPVHLGIVFLANLELGYLTPPVGMNLFFAAYRFNRPIAEVLRAVLPLMGALGAAVLAVTYVPWLSTGLLAWGRPAAGN